MIVVTNKKGELLGMGTTADLIPTAEVKAGRKTVEVVKKVKLYTVDDDDGDPVAAGTDKKLVLRAALIRFNRDRKANGYEMAEKFVEEKATGSDSLIYLNVQYPGGKVEENYYSLRAY